MEELDLSPLPDSPRYVTVRRFAELIGLADDPQRVQAWIDDGVLPVVHVGGHLLVDLRRLRQQREQARP